MERSVTGAMATQRNTSRLAPGGNQMNLRNSQQVTAWGNSAGPLIKDINKTFKQTNIVLKDGRRSQYGSLGGAAGLGLKTSRLKHPYTNR